jgi:osmotically-inducible protein OsmY
MAARRVAGVCGVANDIEARLRDRDRKSDPEIAREAVAGIKRELPYHWDKIQVVVNDGWVDLVGEVEWQYQREAAWGSPSEGDQGRQQSHQVEAPGGASGHQAQD